QNTQSQAEAAQAHGPKTMLKGWKILNLGGLGSDPGVTPLV
ncbi:hypothetical protein ACFDR9_004215, partial [Janthinobacterium sp. CG_23.3]